MKNINKTPTTATGRTLVYLSIFITGSALRELLFQIMNPTTWSNGSIALTLSILVAFIIVGALFACERHIRSRVTSAVTLLVLGFISISIGQHAIPDPYLLVVALCVATIGAQPILHSKLTNSKQTVLYSLLAVFVAVAIVVAFVYGMTVLDRVSFQ